MYGPETQQGIGVVALNELLERDDSGELRDRLIDELSVAADEINEILVGDLAQADRQVLKGLLESVRLSESIVTEVWSAFHDVDVGPSSPPRRTGIGWD